jgi:hypothetical protein
MARKYTNWSKKISKIFHSVGYPNVKKLGGWFENKPSGNPDNKVPSTIQKPAAHKAAHNRSLKFIIMSLAMNVCNEDLNSYFFPFHQKRVFKHLF